MVYAVSAGESIQNLYFNRSSLQSGTRWHAAVQTFCRILYCMDLFSKVTQVNNPGIIQSQFTK